jgi:hypothetical protein
MIEKKAKEFLCKIIYLFLLIRLVTQEVRVLKIILENVFYKHWNIWSCFQILLKIIVWSFR